MLAGLLAATIYSAGFEALLGLPIRAEDFFGKLRTVLPIALIGVPALGVPIARFLRRRGWDGLIQAAILGAVIASLGLSAFIMLVLMMLGQAEGNDMEVSALSSVLRGALTIGLQLGAPGGALAAASFIMVSRLRARWSAR